MIHVRVFILFNYIQWINRGPWFCETCETHIDVREVHCCGTYKKSKPWQAIRPPSMDRESRGGTAGVRKLEFFFGNILVPWSHNLKKTHTKITVDRLRLSGYLIKKNSMDGGELDIWQLQVCNFISMISTRGETAQWPIWKIHSGSLVLKDCWWNCAIKTRCMPLDLLVSERMFLKWKWMDMSLRLLSLQPFWQSYCLLSQSGEGWGWSSWFPKGSSTKKWCGWSLKQWCAREQGDGKKDFCAMSMYSFVDMNLRNIAFVLKLVIFLSRLRLRSSLDALNHSVAIIEKVGGILYATSQD